MKWRVFLLAAFFWVVAGSAQAVQVTINPHADTYTCSHMPTQNFGSGNTLEVRSRDISRTSFVQFNLSHFVPLGATVTRAYLKLYLFDNFCYTNATAPMNIKIYRVTSRWSEQGITYQSTPSFSATDGALLSLPLGSDPGYKTWDVTNIVKGWVGNQYLNYGFQTYYYSANNCQATFYGREAGEGTKPLLVIDYTPPPDVTPPHISDIEEEVSATAATIRWKTYDDPSSSTIAYRRPGAQLWPVQSAPGLTVEHSVTITNLQSETLYQYQIKSRDAAGNEARSETLDFTTARVADTTGPDITNVAVNHLSSQAVEIQWTSQEEATGEVQYYQGQNNSFVATHPGLTTDHRVRLEPLLAETTYGFRIVSRDASDNRTVRPDDRFTTRAEEAEEEEEDRDQDGAAVQEVYNIVSDVLSPTSVCIKWWSRIAGTSWVFASEEADDETDIEDYELVAGRNDEVDAHEVTLTGLAPDTTYSFRVMTRSADEQVAISERQTFATSAATNPEEPVSPAEEEQPPSNPPPPGDANQAPDANEATPDGQPTPPADPATIEEVRRQAEEAERQKGNEPAVNENADLGDQDQKPISLWSRLLFLFSRLLIWIILLGILLLALLGVLLYLLFRKKKSGEKKEASSVPSQPSGVVPSQTAVGQTGVQTTAPPKSKKSCGCIIALIIIFLVFGILVFLIVSFAPFLGSFFQF